MSSHFALAGKQPTTKVIALARVSTERQNKLSPVIQIQRIRSWAAAMGYEVIEELSDAKSGRKAMRDGLKRAIELACEHKAIIVTYDISRLFRNARHLLNTFDLLEANGAAYASVTDGVNTKDNSAFAKFMRTMLGAIGEFIADQAGEKIAASNSATVRRLGHRTNGMQPAGWKLDEQGHRVPCERELATLDAAKLAYEEAKFSNAYRQVGRWRRAVGLLEEWGVPTISQIRAERNNRENRKLQKWTVKSLKYLLLDRERPAKRRGKKVASTSTPT
jgi:predicted site-specific integrase-resolvase